jgi:hypothetical protein
MQIRSRLALAAGTAVIMLGAAAGSAMADRGGQRGHGMHGPSGMGHFFVRMTERYDANKDGKISQEEIDTNRGEWLVRFDIDKDGTLSLKEFEALWLEARRLEMVREFQRFDRDGDAKVKLEEYKRPLSRLVENRDRNGDGFLSKDDRRMDHKRWRRGGGDQDSKPDGTGDQPQ